MRTERPNDRDIVKERLKDKVEDLVQVLALPKGQRQGDLWVSYCPVRDDRDRSSPEFKVVLRGNKGATKCWRCGWTGDIIGLIQAAKGLDFHQAMEWARDYTGLRYLTPEKRRELDRKVKSQRLEDDKDAERRRLFKIARAEEKFLDGLAYGANSAAEAHARRYLSGRNAALDQVPSLDATTFRFHPASEYWAKAEYRNEGTRRIKIKDGPLYPAIHSAMRVATGQTTACHVTWLDPNRPKKILIDGGGQAKMMFGQAAGAVIRISHGPEGEPPELARHAFPLVIGEGIETCLPIAIACPWARVWAGGSLSNIGNAPVWLDCVSAVIFARDNNDGNAHAQSQFEAAFEKLAKHGKPVDVQASYVGDDFNDLAMGEE